MRKSYTESQNIHSKKREKKPKMIELGREINTEIKTIWQWLRECGETVIDFSNRDTNINEILKYIEHYWLYRPALPSLSPVQVIPPFHPTPSHPTPSHPEITLFYYPLTCTTIDIWYNKHRDNFYYTQAKRGTLDGNCDEVWLHLWRYFDNIWKSF